MTDTSKPFLSEQFSDNGEHSHWHLINSSGKVLWSSSPEEIIARGQRILPAKEQPIENNDKYSQLCHCINMLQEKYDENGYDCTAEIKLQRIEQYILAIKEHEAIEKIALNFADGHIEHKRLVFMVALQTAKDMRELLLPIRFAEWIKKNFASSPAGMAFKVSWVKREEQDLTIKTHYTTEELFTEFNKQDKPN